MVYKDTRGKYRTESLFVETYNYYVLDPKLYQPVWTLLDMDKKLDPNHVFHDHFPDGVAPSLRRIYLEYADPIEFNFAMEVFGSDKNWKILQGCKWFKPYIQEWRDALELKLQADMVRKIRDISNAGGKDALSAAKWLAEKGYARKEGKGRPSKQDIHNKLNQDVVVERMLAEDAERIGLSASRAD